MSAGNEIGDLLLDIGLITPEELATAHQEQAKSGERLTLVLERLGLVSYHQLKDALELQFGVNFFSLSKTPPAREISDVLKLETKVKHRVIPVACVGTQYTIAMVNPDDLIALDSVRVELKSGHLKKVVCTADEFEFFMRDTYEVNKDGSTTKEAPKAAAPVAKPAAKIQAKNQLQSLFGDDDDDDDDEAPPTPPAKPAVPAPSPIEKEAPVVPPTPKPAQPVATSRDDVPLVVPQARKPSLSITSSSDDLEAYTPQSRKPAASVTSNSLPAMNPDLLLSPMIPPPVAQRLAEDEKNSLKSGDNHKPASAEPANGSTPPLVTARAEKGPEHPLDATGDHLPVEISIEDVVAGVASHLVESIETNQVLNNNASRQLLEEVVESELGGMEDTDINKLKEQQNSSIMLLAHEIIGKATQKRCSDIHLEPDGSGVTLRYFLHGELLADCVLPGEIHQALVSSYKIIAGLDPNELEKPQDKKITTTVEDDRVELRITTLPSDHGEMVAISMRFV